LHHPKEEHEKREIWTAETLFKALEVCDDDIIAWQSIWRSLVLSEWENYWL
jgi:hypothetical protein